MKRNLGCFKEEKRLDVHFSSGATVCSGSLFFGWVLYFVRIIVAVVFLTFATFAFILYILFNLFVFGPSKFLALKRLKFF